MSNNRMWLRNTRTGKQILLAKYYPSLHWFSAGSIDDDKLNAFFDEHETPIESRVDANSGDNEYTLVYECGEPNEGETVQDPKTGRWRAKR